MPKPYSPQNKLILDHLYRTGEITQLEALNQYGIMRLASRINDLRKAGWRILTENTVNKATGKHYATYKLAA
jgi:hypothetical protein